MMTEFTGWGRTNKIENAFTKKLEQLQEAFDRKSDLYDKLNKDYIKVRDENKRLREQQAQLMSDYQNDLEVLSEHAQFISKLRVERAKLREALEDIATRDYTFYEMLNIADKALEGNP